MTQRPHRPGLIPQLTFLCILIVNACTPAPQPTEPTVPPEIANENPSATEQERMESLSDLDALATRVSDESLSIFFEETHRTLTLRDPETVIQLGLETFYGVENLPLTDISDWYQRETYDIHSYILDQLRTYEYESLTSEEQLSYRIYEWYLEEVLSGQMWMYYDYPITHFLTGVQNQLLFFFTDIHPLATRQDVENYYARLTLADEKIEQLIEALNLREQAGILTPKRILQMSVGSIQAIANSSPRSTPYYLGLAENIQSNTTLSTEEKAEYLAQVEEELNNHTLPAYKELLAEVNRLISIAPTEDGVWQHPDGRAYYGHILHHHTTLSLQPEDIHQVGLNEVDRIQRDIHILVQDLGYTAEMQFPDLFAWVRTMGGIVPEDQIVATYETILYEAKALLPEIFDLQPRMDVVVIGAQQGGFYIPGALDGSRPAAFYATLSRQGEPWYGMPTLTYHETIPGHHLQIALTLESNLPSFRKGISFTAFDEGWALYAERIASEAGWYQGDPYGDLGRLQMELFRAARLVVDTGIHAFGWTYDEALQYMIETTGMNPDFLAFEVSRYIAWPGQATSYKIGMQTLLDLRQQAQNDLGEQFDLRDFHILLLSNGSPPLPILKDIVEAYIQDVKSRE